MRHLLAPLLFFACLISGNPALAQDNAAAATPTEPVVAPAEDEIFGLGWLKLTQAYSTTKADALALQLDRYFGAERSDLESAYSSLRLIVETRWQEQEGTDPRVRLRGTLHLPRINERVSLIFSEDQGEGATYYAQNELLNEPRSTRVNLELNIRDRPRYRFDFRMGLRSNLKLRSSVRYRLEHPFSDNTQGRLSESIYFIDGTGFGSFTQIQFDHTLTESSLLRWSTEFRSQEDLPGNEWSTALHYNVLGLDSGGISYFTSMNGNSAHSYVDQYQTGFRLRKNFAHPWLFWEVSPGVQWVKEAPELNYETGLFAIFRVEMAIGRY